LDLVAPDPDEETRLLVAEVKFRHLTASERKRLLDGLEEKWVRSSLSARYGKPRFEVLDATILNVAE
jgi:hypothetical protein